MDEMLWNACWNANCCMGLSSTPTTVRLVPDWLVFGALVGKESRKMKGAVDVRSEAEMPSMYSWLTRWAKRVPSSVLG